eukprot:13632189-Alexandrium_andersonii.AAC.1
MVAGQHLLPRRIQQEVCALPLLPMAGIRSQAHRGLSPCTRDPPHPPRADGHRCRMSRQMPPRFR